MMIARFIVQVIPPEMAKWLETNYGSITHIEAGKSEILELTTRYGKTQIMGKRDPFIITIDDEKIALLFRLKYNEYIIEQHHIEYYMTSWEPE